jgi:hypothetical protein
MANDNLRLRIELNMMIKFSVKMSVNSKLAELKKLICSILNKNYNIKLPSFSIRSLDGFEVLEIFKLGDILEDNQIVMIDMFSKSRNIVRHENTEIEVSSNNSLSNNNNYSRVDMAEESVSVMTPTLSERRVSSPTIKTHNESISDPVKTNAESVPEKIQSIAEQAKALFDSKKASKSKTISEPKKASETRPPQPDNFKGFVVKKTDLTKGSTVDETCFKPLKKRKMDEGDCEIEI